MITFGMMDEEVKEEGQEDPLTLGFGGFCITWCILVAAFLVRNVGSILTHFFFFGWTDTAKSLSISGSIYKTNVGYKLPICEGIAYPVVINYAQTKEMARIWANRVLLCDWNNSTYENRTLIYSDYIKFH